METEKELNSENRVSYLDEVRKEKQELIQLKEDLIVERQKIEELKANEILSGKADAGKSADKPADISPVDYAKQVLQGRV